MLRVKDKNVSARVRFRLKYTNQRGVWLYRDKSVKVGSEVSITLTFRIILKSR